MGRTPFGRVDTGITHVMRGWASCPITQNGFRADHQPASVPESRFAGRGHRAAEVRMYQRPARVLALRHQAAERRQHRPVPCPRPSPGHRRIPACAGNRARWALVTFDRSLPISAIGGASDDQLTVLDAFTTRMACRVRGFCRRGGFCRRCRDLGRAFDRFRHDRRHEPVHPGAVHRGGRRGSGRAGRRRWRVPTRNLGPGPAQQNRGRRAVGSRTHQRAQVRVMPVPGPQLMTLLLPMLPRHATGVGAQWLAARTQSSTERMSVWAKSRPLNNSASPDVRARA